MKTLSKRRLTPQLSRSQSSREAIGAFIDESIITNDCIRRWPIGHPPSSKQPCNTGGRLAAPPTPLRTQRVPSFVSQPRGSVHHEAPPASCKHRESAGNLPAAHERAPHVRLLRNRRASPRAPACAGCAVSHAAEQSALKTMRKSLHRILPAGAR